MKSKITKKLPIALFLGFLTFITTACGQTSEVENKERVLAPNSNLSTNIERFEVNADEIKNIPHVKKDLELGDTTIAVAPSPEEVPLTPGAEKILSFILKGYEDIDGIAEDYPEILATKTVDENSGSETYRLFEDWTIELDGFEEGLYLDTPMMKTHLGKFEGLKVKDAADTSMTHLYYIEDFLVITDDQKQISKIYRLRVGDSRGTKIAYGDFIGDEKAEIALINGVFETHFYGLSDGHLEPMDLRAFYSDINTQTQMRLDGKQMTIHTRENPQSPVKSKESTAHSLLPDKLFLNFSDYSSDLAPFSKSVSAFIDPADLKTRLACNWYLTNGLEEDILLGQVVYKFKEAALTELEQEKVDLPYGDDGITHLTVPEERLYLRKGQSRVIEHFNPQEPDLSFFDVVQPLVLYPKGQESEDGDMSRWKRLHFEKDGISLDLKYSGTRLSDYHLIIKNPAYTLGDTFKVGMPQEDIYKLLGTPDRSNYLSLDEPLKWSYYTTNEDGNILINYYYAYSKVSFVMVGGVVEEVHYEYFSSGI